MKTRSALTDVPGMVKYIFTSCEIWQYVDTCRRNFCHQLRVFISGYLLVHTNTSHSLFPPSFKLTMYTHCCTGQQTNNKPRQLCHHVSHASTHKKICLFCFNSRNISTGQVHSLLATAFFSMRFVNCSRCWFVAGLQIYIISFWSSICGMCPQPPCRLTELSWRMLKCM